MKIINAGYEEMMPVDGLFLLKQIEFAGRVCYKSEEKITDDSCFKFVRTLIKRGHEAMLEHGPNLSVKFITDRGVTHEIVRHRLFSFAQESTRYCNYGGDDITFILPCWFHDKYFEVCNGEIISSVEESKMWIDGPELVWFSSMLQAEDAYQKLIKQNWTPQQARSVLPNSLKTEIIVTGNIRQWRHFFKLRSAKNAHPQMQEIACALLKDWKEKYPVVFEDIAI